VGVSVPGFWRDETSGVLAPVVEKYLAGVELDAAGVGVMRAYLRQWLHGPWAGPGVARLRDDVERITTTADVRAWLAYALELGIDPL
jgi:hypothetical protein